MLRPIHAIRVVCAGVAFLLTTSGNGHCAEAETSWQKVAEQLREENRTLRGQLQDQQDVIKNLGRRVSEIERASTQNEIEAGGIVRGGESSAREANDSGGVNFGRLNISGEGAVGVFDTGPTGAFPKSEFRADEVKLFLEAPIWDDVYVFSELNLVLRENADPNNVPNDFFTMGELYLDFENVSKVWGSEGQLNVRIGRFDIPFGEEYQTRDAIRNPLISHSLSDTWGVDEGIELFGRLGPVNYALAVQNGGHPALRDYTSDKAVTARIGFAPTKWLDVSLSAMRTGSSDVPSYEMSELWFGGGFIRALGSMATTSLSHAELVELDWRAHWAGGHLAAAGGYIHFDDNDTTADNRRDVYYYYVEGVQELTDKIYFATRWSHILADKGFPVVGYGNFKQYFTDNNELVDEMWRWSFGLGYRLSQSLLFKVEYSLEQGNKISGSDRTEKFLAAEAAFKF